LNVVPSTSRASALCAPSSAGTPVSWKSSTATLTPSATSAATHPRVRGATTRTSQKISRA
jgi:hypothetical protein